MGIVFVGDLTWEVLTSRSCGFITSLPKVLASIDARATSEIAKQGLPRPARGHQRAVNEDDSRRKCLLKKRSTNVCLLLGANVDKKHRGGSACPEEELGEQYAVSVGASSSSRDSNMVANAPVQKEESYQEGLDFSNFVVFSSLHVTATLHVARGLCHDKSRVPIPLCAWRSRKELRGTFLHWPAKGGIAASGRILCDLCCRRAPEQLRHLFWNSATEKLTRHGHVVRQRQRKCSAEVFCLACVLKFV